MSLKKKIILISLAAVVVVAAVFCVFFLFGNNGDDTSDGSGSDTEQPPVSDNGSGIGTETDESPENTDKDPLDTDDPSESDTDSDPEDTTGPADSDNDPVGPDTDSDPDPGENGDDTTGPAESEGDNESAAPDDSDADTTAPPALDTESDKTEPDETETEPAETEPVHKHSYKSKKTDATCSGKGYTTYTCACGDTYKDNYVNALGHKWKAATCTEPKTCSRCGDTSGDKLYHDPTEYDCTTDSTCKRCGKVIVEAPGHDWVGTNCTGKQCARCKEEKGGSSTHEWKNEACAECGQSIWDYILVDKSYVAPDGKTYSIIELLEMTGLIDKVGTLDGKYVVYVKKVSVKDNELRVYLKTIKNAAVTNAAISICEYCGCFPCPDGGDKKCSKYDERLDGFVYCLQCGRPYGDGYNGTCARDWLRESECVHYD